MSCPRCGAQVRKPDLMHSDWRCDNCGDVPPFHVAEHISAEIVAGGRKKVEDLTTDAAKKGALSQEEVAAVLKNVTVPCKSVPTMATSVAARSTAALNEPRRTLPEIPMMRIMLCRWLLRSRIMTRPVADRIAAALDRCWSGFRTGIR